MNTILQKAIRRLSAVLCLVLMATGTQASARTHPAWVQQGIIQGINRDALLLRFQPTGQSELLTIAWNRRTRFTRGPLTVTAAELDKGSLVTISYHRPFFGERFASKIVIEHGPIGTREKGTSIQA
jgi:hypothetical protein